MISTAIGEDSFNLPHFPAGLLCDSAQMVPMPGVVGLGWSGAEAYSPARQVTREKRLAPSFPPVVSLQEERAVKDRNLLQVQDREQPIQWKVQFNLGNSSHPSNQCRNSVQGKEFLTDELGKTSLPCSQGPATLDSLASQRFVLPAPLCLPYRSLCPRLPAASGKLGLRSQTPSRFSLLAAPALASGPGTGVPHLVSCVCVCTRTHHVVFVVATG